MFSKGAATFGKTILIIAAAGYGLMRSLREEDHANVARAEIGQLKARIDGLDLAVSHLSMLVEQAHSRLGDTISREDLSRELDQLFGKLENDVDARFERQTRSVEALRIMVGQTDELLQKVLDGLEAIRNDRDMAGTR